MIRLFHPQLLTAPPRYAGITSSPDDQWQHMATTMAAMAQSLCAMAELELKKAVLSHV